MLTWLLKCEQLILSVCGPAGDMILGQTRVNLLLQDHLKGVYTLPVCADSSLVDEYLARLQLSRLMETQAGGLEGDIRLEELQEALRAMPCGKSLEPYGLPGILGLSPPRPIGDALRGA
ncbi:hypothetical protein NDU88_009045 [Pleurodeles waltl]|uniref:Uncharacterized protein n=1 Tax=Pleurodeles waltl TaxID=8319 RepID=A0AAV7QTJ3_PLEWA|nr:hypothetical protein NDU88_009045 [Pleurodeles waltl]